MDPEPTRLEVSERLAALEVEVAILQATAAEQVRTNRLVVVDEAGAERVVIDARHRTGSVLVRLAGERGRSTGIELYACESEGGEPEIGWCVVRDGEVVSRWTAG